MRKLTLIIISILCIYGSLQLNIANAQNEFSLSALSFDFDGESAKWEDDQAITAYYRDRINGSPPLIPLEELYFQKFWVRFSLTSIDNLVVSSISFRIDEKEQLAWCNENDTRLIVNHEYKELMKEHETIDDAFWIVVAATEDKPDAFIRALHDVNLSVEILYSTYGQEDLRNVELSLSLINLRQITYNEENGFCVVIDNYSVAYDFFSKPQQYRLGIANSYPWLFSQETIDLMAENPELFLAFELNGYTKKNMTNNIYNISISLGKKMEGVWFAQLINSSVAYHEDYFYVTRNLHSQCTNGTLEFSAIVLCERDLIDGEIEEWLQSLNIVVSYNTEAYGGSGDFWLYGPQFMTEVKFEFE